MKKTVVFVPGDGIGPDIVAKTQCVIDAATSHQIEWVLADAGLGTFQAIGESLPENTIQLIRRHHVALKGPTTTPSGHGHQSVNVSLRHALGLSACIRPAFYVNGVPGSHERLDLVVVREGTEGLYRVQEREASGCVEVVSTFTAEAFEKTVRHAIQLARTRRKMLTLVLEDHIFKMSMGLYHKVFDRIVAQEASDLKTQYLHIGAASTQMARWPGSFDVIVTENLLGDMLSDHASALMGGLGVAPGVCLSDEIAVFEAVHGSALDIADQGIANPTALMFSGVMMLKHLDMQHAASRLDSALRRTLSDRRTRDLNGTLNTVQFTREVLAKF